MPTKPRCIVITLLAITLPGESAIVAECGAETIDELRLQADAGDVSSQISLGMRYRDGDGVPRDYQAAMTWYRRAADAGDAAGADNVGFMHLRGFGVPEDFHIAAAYFRASAAKNHAQGLFNLGNCYFSGQGVEQDYEQAIHAWSRAAEQGHRNATWRLATLHASGEAIPQDTERARKLCESLAENGHADGMVLLAELLTREGDTDASATWLTRASERDSRQAGALLELAKWRTRNPIPDQRAYVEVGHLYQGWNNCGATSIAMFARHAGHTATPYDVKRLCPRAPIGTGTDWADLVAAGSELGQSWEMVTFANDDDGFAKGVDFLRGRLDAGQPVVIDFTVIRNTDGVEQRFGHTLLLVGYNVESDQFVMKNPNQPPPGIELLSSDELKASWHSDGYSHLAKGQSARPVIVVKR